MKSKGDTIIITSLFQTFLNSTCIRKMSANTDLLAMFVKHIVITHSALMGKLNLIRRLYSTSLLTESDALLTVSLFSLHSHSSLIYD